MIKPTLMLLVLSVCLLGNTADAKSKKSKKSQKSDDNGIPAQIAALQSQLDALMDLVAVADEATAIVDCDAGDTIADALETPATELRLEISGVCVEDVAIRRGNVTLDGGGSAIIRGSVDVTLFTPHTEAGLVGLQDLTLEDSGQWGLNVSGRTVWAENIVVRNAAFDGILITKNASMTCINCEVYDNSWNGAAVIVHSSLDLIGANRFNDNGAYGIVLTGGSNLTATDFNTAYDIETSGNALFGLLITNTSSAFLDGHNSQSQWVANNNGTAPDFGAGIFVATGSSLESLSTIITDSNSGVGLGVWAGTAYISGRLVTSGHGAGGPGTGFAGVGISDGGKLRLPGHLESTNNIFGVWTRHGFANFGSGDLSGNIAADLLLHLNFTVEINGLNLNSATPLVCDGTETIGNNPQGYTCL